MTDEKLHFTVAARDFEAVVRRIPADAWSSPALGQWDVRALVGHTLRALVTVEEYLGRPAPEVTLRSVGEYLRAAMALPGIHEAVAARGIEAGRMLGDEPVGRVAETVDRVTALVDETPLERIIQVTGGSMLLGEYLRTRVMELVVHTDDLCRALGIEPVAGEGLVRSVAASLAECVDATKGIAMVRALLGRVPLPDGFDLLA